MARLSIRFLGPLLVFLDGEQVTGLRSDKARALLAYLAVQSDQPHRREKLAGMLWPGWPESSARANLRRALADLRKQIGDHDATPPFLLISRQTIQFNPDSDAFVDVAAFCTKPATHHPPDLPLSQSASAPVLGLPISLYNGPFLDGFSLPDSPEFEEWLLLTRERLQRLYLDALHARAQAFELEGDYGQGLEHARRQLEIDPLHERAHRQAIRALALGDQRGAALAQYETCRKLLESELGVEPSPRTRELHERLRIGEWPPSPLADAVVAHREERAVGSCPYRGLAAFREEDTPFFFGRERFVERLLEMLEERPPVATSIEPAPLAAGVVGSSGSGKSSVVFAGLLPRLRERGRWLVAVLRPGTQPYETLAAALLPTLDPNLSETDRLIEASKLADALRGDDLTLGQVVERALARDRNSDRMLLVLDQFEELYTLCPDRDLQRRFLDSLLDAAGAATRPGASPITLLITLRADFMGRALAHRPFADALQNSSLLLGPMTREELRAAIEKPAEKQGVAFEAGLVERILDDVGREPGALPLLEFALTLLWERETSGLLTHAAYEEIGEVLGALARYAEEIYHSLAGADRERARRVLIQLVRPGEGTEDTRRVATKGEIGEALWPLVRHLADRRLVVTGRDAAGQETVEVVHEALIGSWGRLGDWIEDDRAFRTWQEGLRAAVRQWQATGDDEGALLRGVPLAEAEGWLGERGDELGEVERDFIDASVSLREQRTAARDARQRRELEAAQTLAKTERRSRNFVLALAGVLAVATIVALLLTLFSVRQRRVAQEAYSLSLAANAAEALDDMDSSKALALALAANDMDEPPAASLRTLLDAAYAPGPRGQFTVEEAFEELEGPATALDLSPDGQVAVVGMAGGSLALWDVRTGEEALRLGGHKGRVNDVAFGPTGSIVISGGSDGTVILWDTGTGAEIRRLGNGGSGHSGFVRAVDISPDGQFAVSGGFAGESWTNPGELILWDLETGEELRRFEGHLSGVVAATFAADGASILASSGDALIGAEEGVPDTERYFDAILWDVGTGQNLLSLNELQPDAYAVAISPDGTSALVGSFYGNTASLWDLNTGELSRTLAGHKEGVRVVEFSPDGQRALSASDDGSLILWDLNAGDPIVRIQPHGDDVLDVAISPDGRWTLSTSQDGTVVISDLVDAAEIMRYAGHADMVYDVAVTPGGDRILSVSGGAAPGLPSLDVSLREWDRKSGASTHSADVPSPVLFQVAVSPDGRTALVAGYDPFIRPWDLETWTENSGMPGHDGEITGIEFTPDGQLAVSTSVDGTLIVWDQQSGQAMHRLSGHGPGLWSVAISPDGRTALSDSSISSMILWNLETGEEIISFTRDDPPEILGASGIAFMPGGKTAISCEGDGQIIEWDLESGNEVRRIGRHDSLRTRIVISPDGRLALTSGMDGYLMLWDLETGELIRRSAGHGVIFDLTLAPGGDSVLFGSSDTTITQWELANPSLEDLQAWIEENRYVRELTCEERRTYQIEPLCEAE